MLAGVAAPGVSSDEPAALIPKGDRWIEVRTKSFTLYGDASESKTKEVGLEMERLRAVLLAMNPNAAATAPVPTWIYVFRSPEAMVPYLPRRDGEPVRASAFYQGGWDGNYAMLSAGWNTDPRPTVYHSYVYDFIRSNEAELPLWYEVGVAGYYSTFRTEGDEAHIGVVSDDDLDELRRTPMWLSLDRVLAMDRDSPEYLDRRSKSLFFAESWALVHYLMQGKPERAAQLRRYMELRRQGRPQDEAFREAFGVEYSVLYGELAAYVRNNRRYLYSRVKVGDLRPPTEARVAPMSTADAEARLGDLLAHLDRTSDAERFYRAALAADPKCAAALAGLGRLRREAKLGDEAESFLRRAAEAGSTDYRVYDGLGRLCWGALTRRPHVSGATLDASDQALLDEARADFQRSLALNPDYAEALVGLGRTYRFEPRGGNVDAGIDALEQARRRLPTREDVAVDLAALYEAKGEKARADALLRSAGGAQGRRTLAQREARSDFEGRVAEVKRLAREGKFDQALAALDPMIEEASGETRTKMEAYRKDLQQTAALQRAVADYDAALALYNRRDYTGALAAFRKLAAESPDPDVAAAAKVKAEDAARRVAKGSGKP